MTGWRLGWMVGPADIIKGAANLQSHLSSNVSNISQRAAIAALNGPQDAVEEMRRAFDRRRRTIVAELSKIDGMTVPVPQGAFYVYPDVTGLLGREWGGVTPTTSLELADLILDQAEVAAVPGEAFGPSGYLRLSYALGDAPCSRVCSACSASSPERASDVWRATISRRRPPPGSEPSARCGPRPARSNVGIGGHNGVPRQRSAR